MRAMITLRDFQGRWRLERRIENALGPEAVFQGHAEFTADAAGLVLDETGRLALAGQGAFQAERRYLWRQEGAAIAVFFADGRPFHRFDPGAELAEAAHWCDPDSYEVRYDFAAWPLWRSEWRVTGPHKDYLMRSVYHREGPDSDGSAG